jgi:hypothetical protein
MKKNETSLKLGDPVVVKEGITDPDSGLSIGGWQGRVAEITEDDHGNLWITLSWDSITLKGMPRSYVEESEEEGLDWKTYFLAAEDIEPARARDAEEDAAKARLELMRDVAWLDLGEEGRRIQQVLAGIDPDDDRACLEAWEEYLEKNLPFPFEATVDETVGNGPLNFGDRVRVHGISLLDEQYGIIVKLRRGRKRFDHPLDFLAPVDMEPSAAQAISDYSVWFANH